MAHEIRDAILPSGTYDPLRHNCQDLFWYHIEPVSWRVLILAAYEAKGVPSVRVMYGKPSYELDVHKRISLTLTGLYCDKMYTNASLCTCSLPNRALILSQTRTWRSSTLYTLVMRTSLCLSKAVPLARGMCTRLRHQKMRGFSLVFEAFRYRKDLWPHC